MLTCKVYVNMVLAASTALIIQDKFPSGDKVYFQRFWLQWSPIPPPCHWRRLRRPSSGPGWPSSSFWNVHWMCWKCHQRWEGIFTTSAFSFPVLWCDPLHLQVQCCDVSTSSVFSSNGDSLMLLLKLFSPVEHEFVPSTESSACSINADPPDSSLSPGFSSIKVELFFIHLLNIFTDAQTSRTWPSDVLGKILLVLVPPYRPMDEWAGSRFLATL